MTSADDTTKIYIDEDEAPGSPKQQDPKNEALALPSNAEALVVRDQQTLNVAKAYLQDVKRLQAEIAATFDPHIKKAVEAHKGLLAEKRRFTAPLDRAEEILKPKIGRYLYELDQERLRAARERQLAEEKAKAKAEEIVDQAHDLIENGHAIAADSVVEDGFKEVQAIKAAAPEIPPAAEADGVQLRTTWEFEITSEAELPREYLKPDLTRIGQVVRALKDQAKIPGVRTFPKRSVAARIG